MKVLEVIAIFLIVFVYACDIPEAENCEETFEKHFGECRDDIPDDFRMEISLVTDEITYLDTARWSLLDMDDDLSGADSVEVTVYPVSNTERSFRLLSATAHYTSDTLYLDFGNGDLDTVTFLHYGVSGSCCNAHYIDSLKVNGESLVRNDRYYYVFNKW